MKNTIVSNKNVKIGNEASTKLNLLLGYNEREFAEEEYLKVDTFSEKVDIITDLSLYSGSDSIKLWEFVLQNTNCMVGTVPIYQSVSKNGFPDVYILKELIHEQCEKGVSIITIHPTPTISLFEDSQVRLIHSTSRGGGIVLKDLLYHKRTENIYMSIIDEIIPMCKKHNTIISIGSSFRSGTIIDACDKVYMDELELQFNIADYINKRGVNVILETPGHASPLDINIICNKLKNIPYPIMPLGPMPTDIAGDEDDTAAVIGATLMGTNDCADILSIVTCKEHLGGIPTLEDIHKAIKKYKVAQHIIDLSKINNKKEDYMISKIRSKNKNCNTLDDTICLRCGDMCPLRCE